MKNLTPLLVAALSYQAPLMTEYKNLWEQSDQSNESAEIISEMIKTDFSTMKKTTHKGLAQLLNITLIDSYKVPPVDALITHSKPTR